MRHPVRLALALVLAAIAALTWSSAAPATTTWLCRPGLEDNPCQVGLATTPITPAGAPLAPVTPRATARPKVDCFYVYPTVSDQKTMQATRRIDPEQRSIALYQTARYRSTCRVFAPIYRQITLAGLLNPTKVTKAMVATAYRDVRDAWREYLERYNKGRGVIFVSHSQGTYMLRSLLAQEVDRDAKVRRRVVSALLLGGNVLVRKGSGVGGDFRHLPACRSASQLHCVIAFSTYNDTPPADSVFGRPGGRNLSVHPPSTAGKEVLCTNPAALGGGTGTLESIYPSAPFAPGTTIGTLTAGVGQVVPAGVTTPWVSTRAYTASCTSANGANVLLIRGADGAPKLNPLPGATWGLHLVDANIALGNLVDLATRQTAAYIKQAR